MSALCSGERVSALVPGESSKRSAEVVHPRQGPTPMRRRSLQYGSVIHAVQAWSALVSVTSEPRGRGIRRFSNPSSLQPVRQRDQPEDSAGIRLPTNGSVAGHQHKSVGAVSSPASAPARGAVGPPLRGETASLASRTRHRPIGVRPPPRVAGDRQERRLVVGRSDAVLRALSRARLASRREEQEGTPDVHH